MFQYVLAGATQNNGNPTVTINVWVIFVTSVAGAMGVSAWKLLPWVIKKALDEKIDSKLVPMMDGVHAEMTGVHKRIDEHMDNEETSFDDLAETVGSLSTQLTDRNQLFNGLQDTMDQTREALSHHMEHDERQFALSAEALIEGQKRIDDRLEAIERNTNKD